MIHYCHHPSCQVVVPRRLWGCRSHWFGLPKQIRDAIWRSYRPGQEEGKAGVSEQYLEAARAARDFYEAKEEK